MTAAHSEWQHGSIEQIHHHARTAIVSAWQELDADISLQSLLVEVAASHNDLSKLNSVSPNMLAFGSQKRDVPHFGGGFAPLADTLLREDEAFARITQIRQKAREAYVRAEATARLARVMHHKSRPTRGPFVPGERVLVFRRTPLGKTRAEVPEVHPKSGYWYGPAVVLSSESSDADKLRPRMYYIAMLGKLYRCSEAQLKALPASAEIARRRLIEFQKNGAIVVGNGNVEALRPDQKIRGVDISETTLEQDEEISSDEENPPPREHPAAPTGPPMSYGPPAAEVPRQNHPALHPPAPNNQPQAPLPVIVPQAGAPAQENAPALPRPRNQHLDDFPIAALRQHPAQGQARARSRSPKSALPEPPRTTGEAASSSGNPPPDSSMNRRSRENDTEAEIRPRAKQRSQSVPQPPVIPPFDKDSDLEDEADFCHLEEAFFSTPDHHYGKNAIEITIDMNTWDFNEDYDIRQILEEAFATSKAAKRKVEVTERKLSGEERALFRKAKAKEWNSFVDNKVVEIASRAGIDPSRIIGSRWVLTWKVSEGEKVPKARLVLLGYQDPDLGEYARASPTLTRLGRHVVLQVAAQEGWSLFSLDAKNAFLAGELSSRTKALYMSVPKDLLEMLKLPQDTVFKLLKSAYGLAEAPVAWFRYLKKQLLSLGWVQHPLDECVFSIYENGQLAGIIGLHVDDLLVAGNGKYFDKTMKSLESRLPFGEWKYSRFVYCGLQIEQVNKHLITVDQIDYIDKLQPMAHKHLKADKPIPSSEQTNFKGLCGGLGWAVINTRLDYAFDVSYLASKGVNATGSDIAMGNKIMKTMKANPLKLRFFRVGKSMKDWVSVAFHDAGWATRPSLHSQAGAAFFLAEPTVRDGSKPSKAVLLDWVCTKISRVVRSSFEAEINSAQIALDHQEYMNAFLAMCLAPINACYTVPTTRATPEVRSDRGQQGTIYSGAEREPYNNQRRKTIDHRQSDYERSPPCA